jgi:uncharacterized membrane protein YidH (DUF202 family)
MSILKNKKVKAMVKKLPNPKILTILAIALILGVTTYLIILLFNLK